MNSGSSQTYDGYTLYFPQGGTKAYLVDMTGTAYHTWTFSSSATTTYATYLLAGGVLLRTVNHAGNSFTGGPISGEVQKVDWNGNILWDYVYSTTNYCSHHDIHAMPNGNVLLIAYERKTPAEVTAAGCSQSIEMWPDKIVEILPVGTNGGNVVCEWHAWDHLVQHYDATKANYGVVASHPELLNINYNTSKDWMHANGIDYNAELDQIVFSSHSLNEIYVIDHSTTTAQAASHTGGNSGKGGDFLYRWGNPAAYETAGTVDFNVVHDAHWVPSDNPTYPIVTPSVTTMYFVTVGSLGCTASNSVNVPVTPPITVTTSASPSTLNLGQSAQLTSVPTGGSGYTFSWTSIPSGFTSSLQNPLVTPTVTTTYFLVASSGVCNATNSVTVTQTGVAPTLTILPGIHNFTAASGIAFFDITSNSTWTASSNQAWCQVTSSGTGSSPLSATYSQNTGASSRSATIIVLVSGLPPVEVILTQDGADKVLNLTLLLEGLYNGVNMNKAHNESGVQFNGTIADQIQVELRNSTAPYSIAAGPLTANLNTDGTASLTISSLVSTGYYIVLKHRNSIETWSNGPVSFPGSTISYNFSDAASKAYGNNLKEASGKYLIFTGDVNQDGIIDSGDMIPMDNDAASFSAGYIATDTNGVGLMDSGDMILVDNNATSFIVKAIPE